MLFDRVTQLVHIPAEAVTLEGLLVILAMAQGMVLLAHGSGSSRQSPRQSDVAPILQRGGFGMLLLSLETPVEAGAQLNVDALRDAVDAQPRRAVFVEMRGWRRRETCAERTSCAASRC